MKPAGKPKDVAETIAQYTESIDPKAKSTYKLGVKNRQKLEKIRQLAKQMKGAR